MPAKAKTNAKPDMPSNLALPATINTPVVMRVANIYAVEMLLLSICSLGWLNVRSSVFGTSLLDTYSLWLTVAATGANMIASTFMDSAVTHIALFQVLMATWCVYVTILIDSSWPYPVSITADMRLPSSSATCCAPRAPHRALQIALFDGAFLHVVPAAITLAFHCVMLLVCAAAILGAVWSRVYWPRLAMLSLTSIAYVAADGCAQTRTMFLLLFLSFAVTGVLDIVACVFGWGSMPWIHVYYLLTQYLLCFVLQLVYVVLLFAMLKMPSVTQLLFLAIVGVVYVTRFLYEITQVRQRDAAIAAAAESTAMAESAASSIQTRLQTLTSSASPEIGLQLPHPFPLFQSLNSVNSGTQALKKQW